MPRGDRTGPRGLGNMTGRGAGFCAGNQAAGAANSNPGRGGGGRGWCNWFNNMGLLRIPMKSAGHSEWKMTTQ